MNIVQLLSDLIPGRRKRRERELAERRGFICPICHLDRIITDLHRIAPNVWRCRKCRSVFDLSYHRQNDGAYVPAMTRRKNP